MLSRPINLAIVDDHALFRKTLKNFLSDQDNIIVTIQTADVFDLLSKLKTSSIDVLLLDIFLPELISKEILKVIQEEFPTIKILVLSMSTDMGLVGELLDVGVHGYISKADEPEELLQAIYAAADNRIYRNKHFTEALYWNKQNNIRTFLKVHEVVLNERERKIIELIWEEKSNKEIADVLFLGVRSVEKIRQDLKEKLHVKSTVGMLKYAVNKKLVEVGARSSGIVR